MADSDFEIYQLLDVDEYYPTTPKIRLQRYDNYQIYDLYRLEIRARRVRNEWASRIYYSTSGGYYNSFLTRNTPIDFDDAVVPVISRIFSVQKYAPSPITFDLYTLIDKYSLNQLPSYITSRYASGWRNAMTSEHYLDNVVSFSGSNGETTTTNYYLYNIVPEVFPPNPPNFLDLLNGYQLDNRIKTDLIKFVCTKTERVTISYYRSNPVEPIPNLTSIDWHYYDLQLIKGHSYQLSVLNVVLGTLQISSVEAKQAISDSIHNPNEYPYLSYFVGEETPVFDKWIQDYSTRVSSLPTVPPFPTESISTGGVPGILNQSQFNAPIVFSRTEWKPAQAKIVRIAANNNYWQNDFTPHDDINYNPNILTAYPDFPASRVQAYNWHVKTQSDGSYGNLIMDSPRTIEIHKALNAGKYAVNELDNTKQRITDLGFLVERIAKVLGIRFDANGKIDVPKEKAIVRKVVDSKYKIDEKKIGVNCFGDEGIVVKRVNNRFKNKDEIVSDQCVILQDIPQFIQEYFEQSNLGLGLQESSAIEIKDCKDKEGKSKARFDNQLGLLVEIFNLLSSANEMTRAALISSLVTQSQTSEVIAGLGLPSVTKTIPIEIDQKVTQLPYKGIAPHRSISQEVATCTANVGIVLGQLI